MLWNELYDIVKSKKKTKYPLLLGGFPHHFGMLYKYRRIWQNEFVFKDDVLTKVKKRFQYYINVWKNRHNLTENDNNPVVITVHVRRTDYVVKMKEKEGDVVGRPYFKKAFEYFNKK